MYLHVWLVSKFCRCVSQVSMFTSGGWKKSCTTKLGWLEHVKTLYHPKWDLFTTVFSWWFGFLLTTPKDPEVSTTNAFPALGKASPAQGLRATHRKASKFSMQSSSVHCCFNMEAITNRLFSITFHHILDYNILKPHKIIVESSWSPKIINQQG